MWRSEALQAHVVYVMAGGHADTLVDTVVQGYGARAQCGRVPATVCCAMAARGSDRVPTSGDSPAWDADGTRERHLEEGPARAMYDG